MWDRVFKKYQLLNVIHNLKIKRISKLQIAKIHYLEFSIITPFQRLQSKL